MQDNFFDIVIAGAGLIGTSLALALADLPLKIAIVEALPLKTETDLNADGRSLALNYASAAFLEKIHVWTPLQPHANAIKSVHVSERGRFGKIRFTAQEEQVSALGYVIPASLLGVHLNKALLAQTKIQLFSAAKITALIKQAKGYQAVLTAADWQQTLTARLIVAADGANSTLRELAGIRVEKKDTGQSALVTRIELTHAHENVAYERFLPQGALALLPLHEKNAALILTGRREFISELQTLPDDAFLQAAQCYFGDRLGKFTGVQKRHIYPLTTLYASEQIKDHFILLGNAAHTLHPIAAQGFNLGLQDIALLTQLISAALQDKRDFAQADYLQNYAQRRQAAQQKIIHFTECLTSVFAYDLFPLKLARSCGLKLLDLLPPVKHRLAAHLMGLAK